MICMFAKHSMCIDLSALEYHNFEDVMKKRLIPKKLLLWVNFAEAGHLCLVFLRNGTYGCDQDYIGNVTPWVMTDEVAMPMICATQFIPWLMTMNEYDSHLWHFITRILFFRHRFLFKELFSPFGCRSPLGTGTVVRRCSAFSPLALGNAAEGAGGWDGYTVIQHVVYTYIYIHYICIGLDWVRSSRTDTIACKFIG